MERTTVCVVCNRDSNDKKLAAAEAKVAELTAAGQHARVMIDHFIHGEEGGQGLLESAHDRLRASLEEG